MNKNAVIKKAEMHLPGGTTVRIRLEHDEFINNVEFSGDFHLEPQDSIVEIEKCLKNVETISSEQGISNLIEDTIHEKHIILKGANPADFAKLVKKALEK